MELLKGREMVFKAFFKIFLKLEQSKQSEKSKQSEQSTNIDKYTPLKLNNDLNTLSNASHTTFSRDSDIPLFTPKKEQDLKY